MTYPLRRGSTGDEVREWQSFLQERLPDHVGLIDGDFGPRTEAVTREWQAAEGLTADGVVGGKSLARAREIRLGFGLPPDLVTMGLCLITETNREGEMPFVAGVIANRALDRYRGDGVRGVVLAPYQFSRFNETPDGSPPERVALESADPAASVEILVRTGRRYSSPLYGRALQVGQRVLAGANPWRDGTVAHPQAARVRHYYSPVSMVPAGSKPAWWRSDREVLVPAIPRERFRWAWGIA